VIDDQLILSIERLRDSLGDLRSLLRKRLQGPGSQVTAVDLRKRTAQLAETWLTDVSPQLDSSGLKISAEYLADLTIHFQRLLRYSEHAATRYRYELEIKAVLANITLDLIIPLKQLRSKAGTRPAADTPKTTAKALLSPTAFVGHSFADRDREVVQSVIETLTALGIVVVTGERPKADRISEKVKSLIEAQDIFVGIFTRRDKIARRREWTTSVWVVDEKAYAYARSKKLILIKEDGVESIGGIQGDYEFLDFSLSDLARLLRRLLQLFEVAPVGLR
jgi:hypothetical protein